MKKQILFGLFLFGTSLFSESSFDSVYTNFSKDCAIENEENIPEGSDGILLCKEQNGFAAMVTYSACMEFLRIFSKDGKEIIDLPAQPIGSSDLRKLEWRIKKGIPVGIIYRNSVLKVDSDGNCPSIKTNKETLEIRGLGKYSKFTLSLPANKNANAKARDALEEYIRTH